MPGLCRFNPLWIKETSFAEWLMPVEGDLYKANCSLCKRNFAVGSMGVQAVKSHAEGLNHQKRLMEKKKLGAGQPMLSFASKASSSTRETVAVHSELRETHETKSEAEDNVGINDDMDLSDDDDGDNNSTDQLIPTGAKKRKATGGLLDAEPSETDRLKEEKDELKCQVEAFKNEVDMVRLEAQQEAMEKEKQVKALQNALQGMQQQLIAQMSSVTALNEEKDKLEKKLKNLEESSGGKEVVTADKPNGPSTSNNTTITTNDTNTSSMSTTAATTTTTTTTIPTATTKEDISVTSTGFSLSDKEARMVGLISCFLHVHPNGATIDYLWSYLSQMMTTRARDVEDLMEKLPAIFEQKIVGLGATIERKWIFTALRDQTKI